MFLLDIVKSWLLQDEPQRYMRQPDNSDSVLFSADPLMCHQFKKCFAITASKRVTLEIIVRTKTFLYDWKDKVQLRLAIRRKHLLQLQTKKS